MIIVLFLLEPPQALAGIFVPPQLSPGDTFHLAFITEGYRDARSVFIEDYNTFVNAEARRAGAITENFDIAWYAMASTASIAARDNARVDGPVYLLDGTRLASGFAQMWGDIDAPFNVTQFGTISSSSLFEAFTGGAFGYSHGVAHLGSTFPIVGSTTADDGRWHGEWQLTRNANTPLPFFALSQALRVPSTTNIPEQTTFVLGVGAIVLTMVCHRFRPNILLHNPSR
jgi:hypothetical protein